MLIANRAVIFEGKRYERGDAVPADASMNKTALLAAGLLREPSAAEQAAQEAAGTDPRSLKRAELNAHAAAQGVAEPEAYPTKEALLAALPGDAAPSDAPETASSSPSPAPAPAPTDEQEAG